MLLRTATRPKTALVIAFGLLWLLKIAFGQAAQIVERLPAAPAWTGPSLQAAANLIGAVMLITLALLLYLYGRRFWQWLVTLLNDGDQTDRPHEPDEPTAPITRDLYQTVNRLARHGTKSDELLQDAAAQTGALVQICKTLQGRAAEQARIAASLSAALEAISRGDPPAIKEAAGGVRDQHIRDLMQVSRQETDPAFWESLTELIAAQLGVARRWQAEYRQLTASLIGEVSRIKTRYVAATAHIKAVEAARPLLLARVNLDQAGQLLLAPLDESVSPARLFAPQSEYRLPAGQLEE